MTIVEIHPEELFDKLADGSLSEVEQERLSQHLKGCAVCRFEYGARLDFEREAVASEQRIAPSIPLRPLSRTAAAPRRRRPRLLVWGIAAALLISASGALASALGAPPWRAVAGMFVRAGEPGSPPRPPATAVKSPSSEKTAAPTIAAAPAAAPAVIESFVAEPRATPTVSKPHPSDVAKTRTASPASSSTELGSKPGSAEVTSVEPPSAAKLFAEANLARRAGHVGRASGLYHLLQEQYPGSPEAELSRVTLATLLLNAGDASGALAGFERYLAGPSHALEAEALVGRARALQRLGSRQLETAAWREVQRRFPGSVYARQATERLTALGTP